MTDNNNNTYESTPLLQSQKHTHPWYSIDNDNYSTSSNLVYNNNNKSLLQRVKSYITYSSNNNVLLTIYLLSSIVVAVANNITWKSTLDRFKSIDNTSNLEFFVNQWTVFLYVVLAAIILLYRLIKQQISNQQRNFATQKFAFMGLLDAAAGVFSAIGCSFTSGTVQTLCNQGAIPATMFMSRLFLQQYYSKLQYCGAILIVIGALSAALPASMMSGSDSNQTTTLGLLVLLASIIPSSFSNVYKEHNFKSQNLDVYYLTVYVSIFQVLLGFLFVPILSIKGLGGISLSSVPYNFIDGWNCFLGRYVQNYECHLYQPPYIPLLLYVIVNFAYNTLLLLITKHGSALLLVISSALALPLTNLLFTQSYFMGKHADTFNIWNILGLIIVVFGFLMYSLAPDITADEYSEFIPMTGAAGQFVYITDDIKRLPYHDYYQRRKSFDIGSSPSYKIKKQQFISSQINKRAESDFNNNNNNISGSVLPKAYHGSLKENTNGQIV